MLLRYDPFRELERGLDQLLGSSITKGARMMPMDVYRIGDEAVIRLDLPGIKEEDVEITVEKNVLTVKAQRYFPDDQADVLISERPQGNFTRQLVVSDSLDTEKVSASYEAGVLTLKIPVAEKTKARRIELGSQSRTIESGSESGGTQGEHTTQGAEEREHAAA